MHALQIMASRVDELIDTVLSLGGWWQVGLLLVMLWDVSSVVL